MNSVFDFGNIAHEYDAYYLSSFGKEIDRLEKAIIEDFLDYLNTKELFEIGCGTGHWTEFFTQKGFQLRAIDLSEKMIAVAKSKNIKNARFELANVLNLPLKNESLENIVAITALEFTGNQQKAFDEIYRVLKPGGYFICAGLNGTSPFWEDKKEDTVYKNAEFFSEKILTKLLSKFGKPVFKAAAVFENNKFCDNQYSENEKLSKAAFIAALVQKHF